MTIGEAKMDVCNTAVEVVKNAMRDFGAVCENCASYHPCINQKYEGGICRPDCHQVKPDGFCESFRFVNADACEPLYQKIIEGCELNGKELSVE